MRSARLGRDDHVLDFGCGNGRLTHLLASRAGHVTGVDISESLIAAAREANDDERCEFVLYDGVRLPFDDGSFDALVTAVVLQMFCADPERWRAIVADIARTLRPGARAWMIERVVPAETADEWTAERWRSELAALGLEVERITPVRHGAPTRISAAVEAGRVPRPLRGMAVRLDLARTARGAPSDPYTESLIESRRA
jgi:ubiquinone/menaquinone biosynthesis C-methylase UbiE